VREERDAGAVPDRPNAVRGLQPLVDLDSALRQLEPELLQPEVLDIRPAAGRDQQPLRLQRVPDGERDADARPDALDVRPEEKPAALV